MNTDQINTLVAEKVMGWKPQEELGIRYADGFESWGNSPEYTAQKCQNYQRQGLGCTLIKRPFVGDFCPATDMNNAMMVAETFTDVSLEKAGEMWHATVSGVFTAPNRSLPLAICLAALKAVGVTPLTRAEPEK